MSEKPSKSKSSSEDASKEESTEPLPPELDITSEEFDPLKALYTPSHIKITKRQPKIIYQNFAAFEVDYNKKGLYGELVKSKEKSPERDKPKGNEEPSTSANVRRFLPHQMPIQTTGVRKRNTRSLNIQIERMEGPLVVLRDCMENKTEVKIYTRSEHGIRGTITGYVVSFDKHWNVLLRDVFEKWKRRKFGYDENKICGTPSDCSEKLKYLGITVPSINVKSLNRKNVELSRNIPQLLVRGEQIVLVITNKFDKVEAKKQ